MDYVPSEKILERYADVLVNFALGGGVGIKKGEVVRVTAHESAKPLFRAVLCAITKAGGQAVSNYLPDDVSSGNGYNITRDFYELAKPEQLDFFPSKLMRGMIDQIDHSVFILSDADMQSLVGIDPKKIMRRGIAVKPARDWQNEKEHKGRFTWTIALYGTPAMAHEAGLSLDEYWSQIIKACYLDEIKPIAKWKDTYKKLERYRKALNALAPKTDRLHIEGADVDLWIKLGEKRQWLGGSGRNIPSFELFTSPDRRGTEGWIRFNQPLYRYGNKIEGIELHFKNGKVIKSSAKTNEKLLKEMIATPGADMVGEFSLTDKRFSRITRFMAETLFDENIGGPQGNTHIALGMSYKDTYAGNVAKLTAAQATKLGYNDSSVHTDIISTTQRTVTVHLKDGSTKVIYKNGEFTL
ncbi:MAG TPA: aminopeptidase [Candidatus Paceibacterota bacterium]|nr:aminopeptidase [Candidatus Paceibacterota bacterium]